MTTGQAGHPLGAQVEEPTLLIVEAELDHAARVKQAEALARQPSTPKYLLTCLSPVRPSAEEE
jgi:hypothetical protein